MKYVLIAFVLLVLFARLFRRGRDGSATTFLTEIVGAVGRAEQTFTTEGSVVVRGEIWKATSRKGIIQKGDPVRVVAMREGLVLEVEPIPTT